MPAWVRRLDEPLPGAIALDTSFIVAALVTVDPHHGRARQLMERLVEEQPVTAVCWPTLRLELWTVLARITRTVDRRELDRMVTGAERILTGQGRFRFRGTVPADPEGRRRFVIGGYERLLDLQMRALRTLGVQFGRRLLERTRNETLRWGLNSYDALVLAVARDVAERTREPLSLATMDQHFLVVDGLSVWGPPPA